MELTTQEIDYIVNHYLSMRELFNKLHIDVKPNGSMFCPFHENHDTPAAHYYEESDGSACIFCFYEHRIFTNVDLFKNFLPQINLDVLAEGIFNRLSKEEQDKIKYNLDSTTSLVNVPYLESLKKFKFREIDYGVLLNNITFSVPLDSVNNVMHKLYELGESKCNSYLNNKYVRLLNEGNTDYRFLSAYKVLNSGIEFPDYITTYLEIRGDSIILPNIINGVIYSITLRNLSGEKQFLKIGNVSQFLYGLGRLDQNYRYSDTLLLVEGNFDCDVIKQLYPNTLACLTNTLSTNQVEIVSGLTKKVILAYDNDEAGNKGFYISKKKLEALGVSVSRFTHNSKLKDFGDLYDLQFTDPNEYRFILSSYRLQLSNLV